MNLIVTMVLCLLTVSVTSVTKHEELKEMLKAMRRKAMENVEFTNLGLPDYMRPYSLHHDDDGRYLDGYIENHIYVDKEKFEKISDPKKRVDFVRFDSNGATTMFFDVSQLAIWTRTDKVSESSLNLGLDEIDVDSLDQIFPEDFMRSEVGQSLLNPPPTLSTKSTNSVKETSGNNDNGVATVIPGILTVVLVFVANLYRTNSC